jgi:hypothetical protein
VDQKSINIIMLKENKIGQIISMKLTSGDEVVGKVVGQTVEGLTISKPVILAASRDGLAMVPFMMTASPDGDYLFKANNIMCTAETNQQVSDAYIQSTTGIATVRDTSILTA